MKKHNNSEKLITLYTMSERIDSPPSSRYNCMLTKLGAIYPYNWFDYGRSDLSEIVNNSAFFYDASSNVTNELMYDFNFEQNLDLI